MTEHERIMSLLDDCDATNDRRLIEVEKYIRQLERERDQIAKANEDNGREVAFLYRQLRAVSAGEGWRCFHCNVTFYDRNDAQEHFGNSSAQLPACKE